MNDTVGKPESTTVVLRSSRFEAPRLPRHLGFELAVRVEQVVARGSSHATSDQVERPRSTT